MVTAQNITIPATTKAVEISNLTVAYHHTPVLRNVSLELPQGKLAAIIGPNGAGKSTLLKAILGLLPVATGSIKIFGRPYKEQRGLVGYVPQRTSVDWNFPTFALDVVLMGTYGQLGWIKRPGKAQKEWAMSCLEKVGLADYAHRQINQLSGGQQQRVFLARALAQKAQIYFMDEPFASVDALTERAIINVLQELRSNNKTVVCVHHDLETAPEYFDWAILLNVTVKQAGPFSEVFTLDTLSETYGGHMHAIRRLSETSQLNGKYTASKGGA